MNVESGLKTHVVVAFNASEDVQFFVISYLKMSFPR
jgi:hypothetical protein